MHSARGNPAQVLGTEQSGLMLGGILQPTTLVRGADPGWWRPLLGEAEGVVGASRGSGSSTAPLIARPPSFRRRHLLARFDEPQSGAEIRSETAAVSQARRSDTLSAQWGTRIAPASGATSSMQALLDHGPQLLAPDLHPRPASNAAKKEESA